jgi:hypothetical protein
MEESMKNIRVGKAGSKGRGLFTTRAVKEGELVLSIPRAFAEALDTPKLGLVCEWCMREQNKGMKAGWSEKELVEVKRCTGCKIVSFCGKVGSFVFSCSLDLILHMIGDLPVVHGVTIL